MGLRIRREPHLTLATPSPPGAPSRRPSALRALLLAGLALLPLLLAACNPVYVARAGWAQAGILSAREPIPQALTRPDLDPRVAGKLALVWEARTFAVEELGFQNAGQSYTSWVDLPSDTLALVVTAAHRDRLAFHTWWFPITGRVPYRAWFSEDRALSAAADLSARGLDTRVRPVAAFSTLGWFSDPVPSTLLRQDETGVVETVLHELAHNHLFIPGQGRFNESYATFAGHAAAITFFCTRPGGGPDTRWCLRARDRWADQRTVARFLVELEEELREGYTDLREARREHGDEARAAADLDAFRSRTFGGARERFASEVQPTLRAGGWATLGSEELDNARILSLTLYMHRLDDFHRLWMEEFGGDLARALAALREEAPRHENPLDAIEALSLDP
ncbi:MAG: hypothetical protein EA352_11390 [Gemmatimonadales bacterium]|nr:MAG: hypothetical protein EA352_11390 [Gemmatimonadales bacterium]